MTHSLHRFRIQPTDTQDFVFLCTPAIGVNHRQSREKLVYILRVLIELEPDNINFYEAENVFQHPEEMIPAIHNKSRLRCCFAEKGKVKQLLGILKKEDFGLSVVISGPHGDILAMLADLGIIPHTVNISCGCFGRTDQLPSDDTLRILGMCGHGLISKNLVALVIKKLQAGKLTIQRAAELIGRPCTCGIYNPKRTESVLEEILERP